MNPKKPDDFKSAIGTLNLSKTGKEKVTSELCDRIPPASKRLHYHGKKQWAIVTKQLFNNGQLRVVDLQQLEVMCRQLDLYWQADEMINKHGVFSERTNQKTGSTSIVKSPALAVMKESALVFNQIADRYGISPVGRIKMPKGNVAPDDPLARL